MQYAGAWKRFNASLIDVTLIGIMTLILSFAIIPGFSWLNILGLQDDVAEKREKILGILIAFIYSFHFLSSSWQATPGMRWRKIFVVKADGKPINYQSAIYRYMAFSAPLIFDFQDSLAASLMGYFAYFVWFLPVIYAPEKTGVHDLICNTRVVQGTPPFIGEASTQAPLPLQ